MNILILTVSHPFKIAGIVANDLYNGLKKIEGNDVKIVTKAWDKYPDNNIISIDTDFKVYIRRLLDKSRRIYIKLGIIFLGEEVNNQPKVKMNPDYCAEGVDQSITYFKTEYILKRAGFIPDAIIVLFMNNFLSFKNLYELNKMTRAKIYLYPMDMAPFTGGCHYAWDCDGYSKQCGNCPALYSNNSHDQSFKNLTFKKDYIQKTDVSVFTCNTQTIDQINKSSVLKEKELIKDIYPIIDETIFYSHSKVASRNYFKIEKDKKVFFFGANSSDEKRKGMAELKEALKIVSDKLKIKKFDCSKVFLLIAGAKFDKVNDELPFDFKYIGFIQNYSVLALAYSAADFFISPSTNDGGPLMVLQSIYCGTPVISFDIGFARDLIDNGKNGFKAKDKSSLALSNCIFEAINTNPENYILMKSNLASIVKKISRDEVIKRIDQALKSS